MKTKFYYSIKKVDDDLITIAIVSENFWNKHHLLSDNPGEKFYNLVEKYFPYPDFGELMESILEVNPEIYKTEEDVENYIKTIPVMEYNKEFDDFMKKNEE